MTNVPPVPLTLEGASILHQMLRIRWKEWRALEPETRLAMIDELADHQAAAERNGSAIYNLLGHKGDLMLIHFRESFDAIGEVEQTLNHLRMWDYIDQASSYLSVVELGLYESSGKVYGALAERGVEPHSEPWNKEIAETIERQRQAMQTRLYPEIPPAKFLCFYPMDRLRGEDKNWYRLSMAERSRQMGEHGMVGRRYAGQVKQIISGSIGFDDWEWGVDLFAEDPLVFKRLIYEMRFDEVSATYAKFGQFFVGRRLNVEGLRDYLSVP